MLDSPYLGRQGLSIRDSSRQNRRGTSQNTDTRLLGRRIESVYLGIVIGIISL